jgi:regulator of protease activity HflC (stomatin/prohibitin superfamily)
MAGAPREDAMDPLYAFVLVVVAIFLGYTVATAVRRVGDNERGVVFRFGKAQPGPRGPGWVMIAPYGVDRMTVVDVRTGEVTVPPIHVATGDGEEVRIGAEIYYRVADPVRVAIEVPNHRLAVGKAAEGAIRSLVRDHDRADLSAVRAQLDEELTELLADLTEPWGIKVSQAELTEVAEAGSSA